MSLSYDAAGKSTVVSWQQGDVDTVRTQAELISIAKVSHSVKKPRDRMAKFSLVLDGLAVVLIPLNIGFSFLLGLGGIAAGIASLVRIRKGKSPPAAKTAAWLGISLGVGVLSLAWFVLTKLIISH